MRVRNEDRSRFGAKLLSLAAVRRREEFYTSWKTRGLPWRGAMTATANRDGNSSASFCSTTRIKSCDAVIKDARARRRISKNGEAYFSFREMSATHRRA